MLCYVPNIRPCSARISTVYRIGLVLQPAQPTPLSRPYLPRSKISTAGPEEPQSTSFYAFPWLAVTHCPCSRVQTFSKKTCHSPPARKFSFLLLFSSPTARERVVCHRFAFSTTTTRSRDSHSLEHLSLLSTALSVRPSSFDHREVVARRAGYVFTSMTWP